MLAALLLAAAVAGQVSDSQPFGGPTPEPDVINVDYALKANDRALLGDWNHAIPSDTIASASCYSSVEGAKFAVLADMEREGDGGLSRRADGYIPRAGTSVLVIEIVTVEVRMLGITPKFSFAKIRILEGEFKGKELFTSVHNVFRYFDDTEAPPPPKARQKKTN